jgi:hypothetical protein
MTVPVGRRRIILVGGKRHGQWHDVPEELPEEWNVPWPPSATVFATYVESDANMFDDTFNRFDQYYRQHGWLNHGAGNRVPAVLYVAAEACGANRAHWATSAVHIAHCYHQGLGVDCWLHERPVNVEPDPRFVALLEEIAYRRSQRGDIGRLSSLIDRMERW